MDSTEQPRDAWADATEEVLCRFPGLYCKLLKRKSPGALEKRVYLSLVNRRDLVVEGGANRGYFTRLFGWLVGPRGQVHAFEPIPATYAMLAAAVRPFPPGRIILNQYGLADRSGSADFTTPAGDDGQASLGTHTAGSWAGGAPHSVQSCPLLTLDEYASRRKLPKINFLKLDIEGAELLALRGARQVLASHQPLVFFELAPAWLAAFQATPAHLFQELQAAGYSAFFQQAAEIRRLPDSSLSDFHLPPGLQSVNILAIPASRPVQEIETRLQAC